MMFQKELQTVQAKLDALQDKNGSGTPAVKRYVALNHKYSTKNIYSNKADRTE